MEFVERNSIFPRSQSNPMYIDTSVGNVEINLSIFHVLATASVRACVRVRVRVCVCVCVWWGWGEDTRKVSYYGIRVLQTGTYLPSEREPSSHATLAHKA
jgi:hypothetical protein